MGFLNGILGIKSNVNWNKAFDKKPQEVFQGDPNGKDAELPPPYALAPIQEIAKNKNMNPLFYQRCGILKNYDIVLLLDDSGSMNLPTDTKDDVGNPNTRWTELLEVSNEIVEIAVAFDHDGIDVHFLNRSGLRNVTKPEKLSAVFRAAPKGGTPLAEATKKVLQEYRQKRSGKKLLLIIATDGEPSGNGGKAAFKSVLTDRDYDNEKVSILACSDNDDEIGYLNEYDRNIPSLDVVDDYRTEKKEIRKIQGSSFPFKRVDYILKCLLGSVDKWTDQLDEVKLNARQLKYAEYGDF